MNKTKYFLGCIGLIVFSSFTFSLLKKPKTLSVKAIDNYMVYIPKGKTLIGTDTFELGVENFLFVCDHEVTNWEYQQFTRFTSSENTPDTLVWLEKNLLFAPYINHYFQHPAYQDYPVVGVTHQQAIDYCNWLTTYYNAQPKRKFNKVKFRLPTHNEWVYAAKGGNPKNEFPWKGLGVRNKDGWALANFKIIPQRKLAQQELYFKNDEGEYIKSTYTIQLNDGDHNYGERVTVRVGSYWPNEFGLSNMAGNVEEMVAEYGITKGGSWDDTGYYLRNSVSEPYDATNECSAERGFRVVMEVIEK